MKTPPIYRPRGMAREYSPLGLNIYTGCDHGCTYCYNRRFGMHPPKPRKYLVGDLMKQLESERITEQVHISFIGDPYCIEEYRHHWMTRQVLEILLKHQVPVQILTKGGSRCLRDLDLFREFKYIKVGSTLTFETVIDSTFWEPGAADPGDRLDTLAVLAAHGIRTWVSMEPVISPEQSFRLITRSLPFVDEYKVGRWNHDVRAETIGWRIFGEKVVRLLRSAGKSFYVKKGLQEHLDDLRPEEIDMDRTTLRAE